MANFADKDSPAPDLLEDFVAFLNEAWTAYHATAEARRRLLAAGFEELDESQPKHHVEPGGKYFFTRNMSAIAAFAVGGKYATGDGFVIIGAHTDSPCPKLKPVSKAGKSGFLQVGTQPYGGGLWHTWFDRDLGVAGRAIVSRGEGKFSHDLVKINRPVLRIPTLAIHLTKTDERSSFKPNLQNNFYPILATEIKAKLGREAVGKGGNEGGEANAAAAKSGSGVNSGARKERHHSVLLEMLAAELGCQADDIKDFELQLCDSQPSCVGGVCSEFVLSGRLDNLCSSWQSLRALIDTCEGDGLSASRGVRSIFLFDHEEIGSSSCQGAAGTLLPDCMKRRGSTALAETPAEVVMESVVRRSFLVSADMAHALHPNYSERHDPALGPAMHGGMVLKHNANQRYATNAVTAFLFRELGERAGLPTQEFAVKSDSGCGSTIGPILSALSGIRTVDVGSPQLSMHSIREMMGVDDALHGYEHLKAVLENFFDLDAQLKVDAAPSVA
ncbi:unnamed protein product [Ascophyllum nodosum]